MTKNIINKLNLRREHLGISQKRLSEMTGIPLSVIHKLFSGRKANISNEMFSKITRTLGLSLSLEETTDKRSLLEKQAHKKASILASMIQGTSALEGHGLTAKCYAEIEGWLFRELMTGSKWRLWSA